MVRAIQHEAGTAAAFAVEARVPQEIGITWSGLVPHVTKGATSPASKRCSGEAVELLRSDRDFAAVLGEAFVTVYAEIKEIEQAEFMKVISPWEREHLLLHA